MLTTVADKHIKIRRSGAKKIALAMLLASLSACNSTPQQVHRGGESDPSGAPEAAIATSRVFDAKPVSAKNFMISVANPLAAQAGYDILKKGGSAVDAAIAAQMVLNVVEPQSSGIGGGGFLLHYGAKGGLIEAYDGRETAPAKISPKAFLNKDGSPKDFYDAAVGGGAVGVPGLLAMFEGIHARHGKLKWPALFQPAIDLAENGFPVSERLHGMIAADKYLKTFKETAAYFYDEDGKAWPVGHTLKNPELADTFRTIATYGSTGLYRGKVADKIVKAVNNATVNPGVLSHKDLGNYIAKERDPLCQFYQTWLICGMSPPSSGGLAVLQTLGILEKTDFAKTNPNTAEAVHLISEAERLAFADRNTYVADPDFIPVPQGLLNPSYLKSRAEEIKPGKSLGKAFPGMPGLLSQRFAPDDSSFGYSTTHISVIDAKGNAVSLTSSIENAFGSRLMAGGFLLNNQLTDFSFVPEKDGAPVANAIEPKKRPRSSMSPVLVFDSGGKVILVTGSPGGSRIIGYVTQNIINVLNWNMDVQEAINQPHFLSRNGPTELEAGTPVARLKKDLEALGHKVTLSDMTSGLHGIQVTKDGLLGGADPRREGIALGN